MTKSPIENDPVELPYGLRDRRQLKKDERFQFDCHNRLDCFTRCCADVTILLTPVDVLRLSRRLKMSTTDFLGQHTLTPVTKALQLPVVMLRMNDDPDKRCPFVDESRGCAVYEDRPWSCRMYPLGMALPPARAGVEPEPIYFLFEDDFCRGRGEAKEWTAARWLEDQGIAEREETEKGFYEVVSHPWFIGGRQLDPKRLEMFYMASFDLDTFRRFVFSSTFLDRFELEDDLVEKLRNSDEELLRFSPRWLRFSLFGEPTLKAKDNQSGRNS
jgi:Fe-S-cluster containining protein